MYVYVCFKNKKFNIKQAASFGSLLHNLSNDSVTHAYTKLPQANEETHLRNRGRNLKKLEKQLFRESRPISFNNHIFVFFMRVSNVQLIQRFINPKMNWRQEYDQMVINMVERQVCVLPVATKCVWLYEAHVRCLSFCSLRHQ